VAHFVGDEKDIRSFWVQRDPSLELNIVRLLDLSKTSSNFLDLEIFVDPGEQSPWPSIRCKSFVPRDSGGEASLKQLNRWLETCRTQCKLCASYEQRLLPDRLIQVRSCTGADEIKLVDTRGGTGNYVALSHCWGMHLGSVHEPLKLTKSTLKSRKRSIR
jgi:hypothetical protein